MIRLDDVHWQYAGAETAMLDGIDLHIARGETVLLCGASGSGKSSVLRLMNGLIPHFHDGVLSGDVYVGGQRTAELALDQIGRLTGTVLQNPRRQFFTSSVRAELAFASENFGEHPEQIRTAVESAIGEHGLREYVAGRLQDLSGGQQQQVACAAACTHRPELVLFDEPTANLAPAAIAHFTATVARLRAEGVTLVIAEHRLHFLRGLVDRVIVLQDGHVETVWSGDEFASITDELSRSKGLRQVTAIPRPEIPAARAHGPSVANASTGGTDRAGLTLRGIGCAFRGRLAIGLDEAHFPAGKVTAVTGPNGAGKTTLARIVVGLQRHDGEILLDGRRVGRAHRLKLSAIVMQDVQRQLFTDSVRAELRLGLAASTSAKASGLLAEFGLDGLGDRHPLSLSGGQQQRLVVAAARLSGRRIVVFDEPSSGVDGAHLRSIADTIRGLAQDGAVVILISHDDELLALAADQELRLNAISPA